MFGKSGISILRSEYDFIISVIEEVVDATLPRKASKR